MNELYKQVLKYEKGWLKFLIMVCAGSETVNFLSAFYFQHVLRNATRYEKTALDTKRTKIGT